MLYFLLRMGDGYGYDEVSANCSLDVLDPVESRIIGAKGLLVAFLSNSLILQVGIQRPGG